MFGNDDFFDEIERAFFGRGSVNPSSRRYYQTATSRDQNSIVSNFNAEYDRVDSGSNSFIIVNIMDNVKKGDLVVEVDEGFGEKDNESEGWLSGGDKVLFIKNKAKKDSYLKIRIPKSIARQKMTHQLNNGILEVKFGK